MTDLTEVHSSTDDPNRGQGGQFSLEYRTGEGEKRVLMFTVLSVYPLWWVTPVHQPTRPLRHHVSLVLVYHV